MPKTNNKYTTVWFHNTDPIVNTETDDCYLLNGEFNETQVKNLIEEFEEFLKTDDAAEKDYKEYFDLEGFILWLNTEKKIGTIAFSSDVYIEYQI